MLLRKPSVSYVSLCENIEEYSASFLFASRFIIISDFGLSSFAVYTISIRLRAINVIIGWNGDLSKLSP